MSDDFAAGMRRALEIGRAYVAQWVENDGGIDQCDIEFRTDLETIDEALAILAASPAPWTPPEDRRDGYRCLAWVMGEWESVWWHAESAEWRLSWGSIKTPTHFRDFPPSPEDAP